MAALTRAGEGVRSVLRDPVVRAGIAIDASLAEKEKIRNLASRPACTKTEGFGSHSSAQSAGA